MLQQGLTNPQIADRLGISLDGAKYHVSEIMGKLGAASREEAAAIVLAGFRPWWMAAFAPIAPLWRRMRIDASTLAAGGAIAVGTAAIAGLGVIAFLLLQNGDGDSPSSNVAATATAQSSVGIDTAQAFAGEIDSALQAPDQQFFIDNVAYQDVVCGPAEGPPGYPRACQGLPDGATSPGLPVSVLNSEGTYYDPAQYGEDVQAFFKNNSDLRLVALATRDEPFARDYEGYSDVYEAIAAGSEPLEGNRHIYSFTIGRGADGWDIIGLTLGSPPEFLDYDSVQPGDDWAGFFLTWERWEG